MVSDAPPLDLGKQLRDAVLEDLGADHAGRAMRLGLRREMLAAAEAELEPDRFHAAGNSARGSSVSSTGSATAIDGSLVSRRRRWPGRSARPRRRP